MSFKRTIHAVDTHAGIPMRVITGGVPHIPGDSVHAKMKWLETNDDQLRKLMLREPRGYPAHCCNIIVPPSHPEADAGYIIMEQIEYPVSRVTLVTHSSPGGGTDVFLRDLTKQLGGENYVFWGGREGYETLLNTNLGRELDNYHGLYRHVVADAGDVALQVDEQVAEQGEQRGERQACQQRPTTGYHQRAAQGGSVAGADGVAEGEDQLDAGFGVGMGVGLGQDLEGAGLERVAGEDGGGFVEGDVHGGAAAAQGVVVHRRQVVVHERIRVHQFDRGRGRIAYR